MSQTKLTLSIDAKLVEKAKAISKARGTSVSQLVSRYFDSLPTQGARYAPLVERWTGLLPQDASVDEYYDYLEEKHGA